MKYKKMFEPVEFGKLKLRNRVVMGPMGTGYADENHAPTPTLARYYEERAKGGVGLIICEHTISQPVGYWGPHAGEIFSDESVAGWKMVVDAVHKHGAKVAIEIGHMGRSTNVGNTNGLTPIAPSAVPCHMMQSEVHEVTIEEIEQFKKDYLYCVKNAKKAGFDSVELHFTNGYFLAEWLSGRTNKRTDEYGGNVDRRMKLPLEIVRLIKREVGPDFPIIARLASEEPYGGRDVEETKLIAKALEDAGVDILDVNTGSFSDFDYEFPPYYQPQGFNLKNVEEIKKSVSIPVIAGGRIVEPRMGEQILAEGRADLVQVNRCHITDPEWVKKAASDETDGIMRCIGCTRCIDEILPNKLVCSVNPFVGREEEFVFTPAPVKKKVLVIGGGPAGLQAAVVAAKRNHSVTLVEKESQLGGLVRPGSVPPMKWETAGLIATLSYQAEKAGVCIMMNTKADIGFIKSFAPDAVILATGSAPFIPKIPGIDGANVITGVDLLSGKAWVGNRVAIIGGGMVGCEVADFLTEYGKEVTIYEMLDQIASDMWTAIKMNIVKRLKKSGVELITSAKISKISEGIVTYSKNDKKFDSEPFDTIVIAAGMKSCNALSSELNAEKISHNVIGDASDPSRLHEVLTSAVEVAFKI